MGAMATERSRLMCGASSICGGTSVMLQRPSGEVCSVVAHPGETIKDIKKKFQDEFRFPMEAACKLSYGGLDVMDNTELPALQPGRREAPVLLTQHNLLRSTSSPMFHEEYQERGKLGNEDSSSHVREDSAKEALELVCDSGVGGGSYKIGSTRDFVQGAIDGLSKGHQPELLKGGMGGAYMLRSVNGKAYGVLKPSDEEPLAPNNPHGVNGRTIGDPGMKRTIRVGEAAVREVAAYLIDHKGNAGVPRTALVRAKHESLYVASPVSPLCAAALEAQVSKVCSLQEYVNHDMDASDWGTSSIPVREVHKIGILDLRICNTDRHGGNILIQRGSTSEAVKLVPIDHGYAFPEALDDIYFEWLHWKQASQPFSADELEYIRHLNPDQDAHALSVMLPSLRISAIRTMILTTTLLQTAAFMGSNLSEIGGLISRSLNSSDADSKSPLELLVDDLMEELYHSEGRRRFKCVSREFSQDDNDLEETFFHLDLEEDSCLSSFSDSPRDSEMSSTSWKCQSGTTSPLSGRARTPQELPEDRWQSFLQMYRRALGDFVQKSRSGCLTKSCAF